MILHTDLRNYFIKIIIISLVYSKNIAFKFRQAFPPARWGAKNPRRKPLWQGNMEIISNFSSGMAKVRVE